MEDITMNEFSDRMKLKSDDELIWIVFAQNEAYRPLAVEAAKNELEKRQIAPEIMEACLAEIDGYRSDEKKKAEVKAPVYQMIFVFVFPFAGVSYSSAILGDSGYAKAASQLGKARLYGFVMYIVLAVAIAILMSIYN